MPPTTSRVLAHRELAGSIERVEQSDGSVRYTDIKILSEGVWTDQSSKKPTHYAPANLEVSDAATVNIAHDDNNDVSAVGEIDAASAYVEDGDLYADVVLHMSNAASEYADENMQQTLSTGGKKGFGGPSVEIPPEGLEISERGELGYPKTEAGIIDGLGLVKNPASKPTAFDTQTRNRQVALSNGRTDKALVLQQMDMNVEELREILNNYGFENLDDMSDEDVMEVASDLHEDLMGEIQDAEMEDGMDDEEDDEDSEMGDYSDDDEDNEDRDMQDAVDVIQEQIDDLWDALDEMKGEMMSDEDLDSELAEAKSELAAAETVRELQEARDELDDRLSEIENQEAGRKTLADGSSGDDEDFEPVYDDAPSSESSW